MKYNQPLGIANPDAPYFDGDPSQGLKGSIIPAAAVEYPQREVVGVVDKAGFDPANDDLLQLTRGVRQGVNYVAASFIAGADNDYVVTLDPPLDEYRPGLVLRIKIPVENTGPTTLRIDELGNRPIHRANGAVTTAGDLVTGMVVALVYDGAAWQIVNFMGLGGAGDVNNFVTNIPYVVDTGTPNHVVAPFVPPITALAPGLFILVKVGPGNTNTTKVDIKVNTLAIVPVIRCDLQPLAAGDIIPGQIIVLCFDGVSFQMVSMPANAPRVMTAPMTYYVNGTTGSDTLNDGLTAATPFKTIQHAIDMMLTWTNRGYTFSIIVADGTYANIYCGPLNGAGECLITGNFASPWQCTIQETSGNPQAGAILVSARNYRFGGFRLTSTAGRGIVAIYGASIEYYSMDFGSCPQAHIHAYGNSFARQYKQGGGPNWCYISGSAYYHWLVDHSQIEVGYNSGLSIRTSVVTNFFASISGGGLIQGYWPLGIDGWGNVIAGTRYNVVQNSVLSTGAGASYLPGTYEGTVSSGGVAS